MRKLRLVLLSAALVIPVAALAQFSSVTPPPRCRVEAIYTPRWGSEFGTLLVRLLPGCPPGGVARIRLGGYGGPGSKNTGPPETLSPTRPALLWQAQPRYRSVLWEARSGAQYPVPIQGR